MRSFMSVLGMLCVGCGGGGDASTPDAEVVVSDACVATSPWVAYLHRGGGTYTEGVADSRTNTAGFLSSAMTLPAPTIVEQDWLDYVACVESKFTGFNVSITTTDPGTAPHLEVVIIDRGEQIGLSPGADATTPVPSCRGGKGLVTENGVSAVAWETLADTGSRCQKSAQTIGFLLGLDRAFACNDIMTWDTQFCIPRGDATFVDAEVPCGETEARTCNCGFPTENTFRALQQGALQCPQ